MRFGVRTIIVLGAMISFTSRTSAANSPGHDVTIQVLAIDEAAVSGGETLAAVTAEQDPDDAVVAQNVTDGSAASHATFRDHARRIRL